MPGRIGQLLRAGARDDDGGNVDRLDGRVLTAPHRHIPLHPIIAELHAERLQRLPQKTLVHKIGIFAKQLSSYETGRYLPVLPTLVAWAQALDPRLEFVPDQTAARIGEAQPKEG